MYIIREFQAADKKTVQSLMRESANEQDRPIDNDFLAKVLAGNEFPRPSSFVMFVSQSPEGEIFAYILASLAISGMCGRVIFAEDTYVMPSYRQKGIASALLKKLAQMALDDGSLRCDIYLKTQMGRLLESKLPDYKEENTQLVFQINKQAMERYVQKNKEPDEIEIREATKTDCPAMFKLLQRLYDHLRCLNDVVTSASVLEKEGFHENPRFKAYIAEKDGEVIGYTTFFFTYHLDGMEVFMEDLYACPEFRGAGVGTALWGAAIKEGLKVGCERCTFCVASFNTESIAFYKKRGAVDMTEIGAIKFQKLNKQTLEKVAKA